jgi:AmmeMemoRadiSam system protein A
MNKMTSEKERAELLKLARTAIINHESKKKINELKQKNKSDKKCGVFVSVYVNEDLRGCIGNLSGVELHEGVINNAIHAAFSDSRFDPISEDEYSKMKIHINILSEPIKMDVKNYNDLLKQLNSDIGLIIKKGMHSATFLPSVWEQLSKKEEFLEHLCQKAGLNSVEWKKPGMIFYSYTSVEFSE